MNKRIPVFSIISLSVILIVGLWVLMFENPIQAQNTVRISPAAEGEPLSTQFQVSIGKANVPVYLARICSLTAEQRAPLNRQDIKDTTFTSFASFDMNGPAKVTVTCNEDVQNVKLLPSSYGIEPKISGKTVTFEVRNPGQITMEVNGNWVSSLHLFANPMEKDIPNPNDPNVIYFGPGVHHVKSVLVKTGQTVYIADGAIVYGEPDGDNPRRPIFHMLGSNTTLRGRGIIDGSKCPRGTRTVLEVNGRGRSGSNVNVDGIILRDSCGFTLTLRNTEQVKINGVKLFGWRGNTDGIDICNSRQVEVSNCFARTFDDLVVLKSDKGDGEVRDVSVKKCVLWNEFAHALSLGAELREPLSDITFSDCDIIHDKGRCWLLRIFNADSAPVKNVTFDNIRIEEARKLMSVWIGAISIYKQGSAFGTIDGVTFNNIQSPLPTRPGPLAEVVGGDETHTSSNVRFQNVTVGGRPLQESDIQQNAFVNGVSISH